MDNYNGINQFEVNQMNQSNQNQYMQSNCNQYQQCTPNYNGDNSCNIKAKKNWFKWLLLIGIPTVAIIMVILMVLLLRSDYNIDNSSDVKAACKKAFGLKMEKIKLHEQSKELYGYEECYQAMTLGGPNVCWYKFESEEAAETYFNCQKFELRRSFYAGSIIPSDIKIKDDYVELSASYDDERAVIQKTIVIIKDEYVVRLDIKGVKEEVERLKEKFLDEIS